ncbi:MAG TPA: MFS transporter [Crinalium sp.]|jgi:predicted MFS family arabinose efflux permease
MWPASKASLTEAETLPPKQTSKFLVLLAAGCLTTMTGGIVAPVLPEMIQELHLINSPWSGMLVSTHALTSALCTPLLGILADRVGKLKVMIPALICYTIFGVLGAFIPQLLPLLLLRGLLGAASGGVAAASIGLLGNLYEGEARSRVLGYATSAMTTASIMIPIVGGWVGAVHWQHAFYLYALGLPLAFAASIVLRDESSQHASILDVAGQRGQLGELVRNPKVLRLYLILALAATVVYAVVIYTPIYLKETIGAGPELNGIVLGVRAIGAAIVSAIGSAWLARMIGTRQAIAFGFVLMGAMLFTIPFLTDLRYIMPTAVLFGVGFGIITPNTYNLLAGLAPAEVRASVLAIGTGANSLGQFISPIVLGPIWKTFGLPAVFYLSAGLAVFMGILNLLDSRQED